MVTILNSSLTYVPAHGSWLACTSGLIRCLSGSTTTEPALCIAVHVLLQVYAYSGPEGQLLLSLPGAPSRSGHAASLIVLVLVGLRIGGSAALSTTLVRGEMGLISLSEQIDAELRSLQQIFSIPWLNPWQKWCFKTEEA